MKEESAPDLLFVTNGLPPEQVGGVELHALHLGRRLRELGLAVEFYCRGEREDLEEYRAYQGRTEDFPVTRVVYRWSRARSLRHIYDDEQLSVILARRLERSRPRLVHVHHLAGLGLSCLERVKEAGLPLVMTLHDYLLICPRGQMVNHELEACPDCGPDRCTPCIAATWPALVPSGSGRPFAPELPADEDRPSVAALQEWLRSMANLPDLLLTPSAAARERFIAAGLPGERIRVVENGIDPAPFTGIEREPAEQVRFGFVGSIIPSKGVHTLLEAFARLPAGSASLVVAGNAFPYYQYTGYEERIAALAREVPPENPVELLGPYTQEELPGLLARIDVLVVPPLWHEIYGLTLREGMAAGCAVIAARTGGLTQAIDEGRNGFTFTPGAAQELAGVMMDFIQDRGLAARLGSGNGKVRSLAGMAGELLAIYGELGLEGKG